MLNNKSNNSNKWKKENLGQICVSAKKEVINNIKEYAIDNNIQATKLLIACCNYCIDNNINISDLKKYI